MKAQPQQKIKPLDPHYYQRNFIELISFVDDNYHHLLNDCEVQFLSDYRTLTQPAQQLYCRLVMRKRHFFRAGKVVYPEIANTDMAMVELVRRGFCTRADIDDIPLWIELYRRDELHAVVPTLPRTLNTTWLVDTDGATDLFLQRDLFGCTPVDLLQQIDTIYRIEGKEAFVNFQLLFFGDLYQDISAFVLRDLGLAQYETTLHDNLPLPFTSRAQLLAHRQYFDCVERYDDSISGDISALIEFHHQLTVACSAIAATDITLNRRFEKWSNRIARQLEKLDAIDQAALIYEATDRPPARERLARIRARQGRPHDAYILCKAIIDDPGSAAELDFAEQFVQPLAKSLDAGFLKVKKYSPPTGSLTLPVSQLPVEHAAALHYAKTGKCFYVENSLIANMFGLAMWDVIFAPIDGAFFHPFQSAPSDFHASDFTDRRRDLFNNRLQQIRQLGMAPFIMPTLHQKRGINNPLVNWFGADRNLLVLALQRIPVADWLSIFEYLLQDIPAHRSGLPDLLRFPDTGGYELLEVKGPGDQLQKNQRRWMKHFAACGIPHAVVKVDYADEQTNDVSQDARCALQHSLVIECSKH